MITRLRRCRESGQSLAEFAMVIPVFLLILGGTVQFGIILWGQNTLNQVTRDTGRFAATLNCSAAAKSSAQTQFTTLMTQAGGPWASPSAVVTYQNSVCPTDSSTAEWVTVVGTANAPIFFPWVPGNGALQSSTQFRVEPAP